MAQWRGKSQLEVNDRAVVCDVSYPSPLHPTQTLMAPENDIFQKHISVYLE